LQIALYTHYIRVSTNFNVFAYHAVGRKIEEQFLGRVMKRLSTRWRSIFLGSINTPSIQGNKFCNISHLKLKQLIILQKTSPVN